MYYAYKYGAAPALAEYLYKCAASKYHLGDTMWDYFAQDKRSSQSILAFLISTMHPDVVRALICGNLTYKFHSDFHFRHSVQRTTSPSEVVGIYMLQWYSRGHDPEAQTLPTAGSSSVRPRDFGKGFSLNDWIDLKQDLRLYLSPAGNDLAQKLDTMFIPQDKEERKIAFDKDKRLFAQNKHQIKVIEDFCKMIERKLETIAQGVPFSVRADLAEFSPALVGYGAKCSSRARGHLENKSSSALFGLVNCDIKYRLKGRCDLQIYQLLYICDPSHRNLAEAVCSVLASSYHDELGFNGKRRGAIGAQPDHTAVSYRRNIDMLFGWGPPSPGGSRRQSTAPEARGWIRSQEHIQICLDRLNRYRDPNKAPLDTLKQEMKEKVENIDTTLAEAGKTAARIDIFNALKKLMDLRDVYKAKDKKARDAVVELAKNDSRFPQEAITRFSAGE